MRPSIYCTGWSEQCQQGLEASILWPWPKATTWLKSATLQISGNPLRGCRQQAEDDAHSNRG